jgi:GAF domain-containing protein
MSLQPCDKIRLCVEHINTYRARAEAETDPVLKAELRGYEAQWFDILESYKLLDGSGSHLAEVIPKPSDPVEAFRARARRNGASFRPPNASLADLLKVLVYAAVEHADGEARAAFYLADDRGEELYHITGMTEAYARYVNGFVIGERSLACGLAVARRQPVVTPDVSAEPRWKPWLWLAEEFHYRACWSFPIAESPDKPLGSFALYFRERREATPRDLDFASVLTRTAATLITRH